MIFDFCIIVENSGNSNFAFNENDYLHLTSASPFTPQCVKHGHPTEEAQVSEHVTYSDLLQ